MHRARDAQDQAYSVVGILLEQDLITNRCLQGGQLMLRTKRRCNKHSFIQRPCHCVFVRCHALRRQVLYSSICGQHERRRGELVQSSAHGLQRTCVCCDCTALCLCTPRCLCVSIHRSADLKLQRRCHLCSGSQGTGVICRHAYAGTAWLC